jgi:hypothetical protein
MLLAAGLVPVVHEAQAQVYRCDSDSGVPVYQGTPSGRNCRALDLAPLTTIPAPNLPPAAKGAGGSAAGASGKGASASGQGGAGATAGPSDFPRVDPSTQRARDSDRRRILQDELEKEERRLVSLREEYKGGEPERLGNERNYQKYLDRVEQLKADIDRSEANIAALRREIAAIRE